MKFFIICLLVATACAAPSGVPQYTRGRNKIVGGTDVLPGELPYQISFQDTSFGFNFHFCGGTVYSKNFIICAGHCVYGKNYDNPRNLRIVAGDNDLSVDEGTEQNSVVDKIILHEDYDSASTINDISLLRLKTNLRFDSFVKAIPIPSRNEIFSGTGLVSGWGTLTEGGATPDVMKKVTVNIISDAECRASYGQSQILDSMMCCHTLGKDSCQGDSGGPLNCGGKLCGVVSWGYGCARPLYPGVYTEVSHFVDWIKNNAGQP